MSRPPSPRIDRRVGNAYILRAKLADFKNLAAKDMATEQLQQIMHDALIRTARRRISNEEVADNVANDAADVAVGRVWGCSLFFMSAKMDMNLIGTVLRRKPHLTPLGQTIIFPPADVDIVALAGWEPEWLYLFLHLLFLSRRCFAAIRSYIPREYDTERERMQPGWKGRLSDILHGTGRKPVFTSDFTAMAICATRWPRSIVDWITNGSRRTRSRRCSGNSTFRYSAARLQARRQTSLRPWWYMKSGRACRGSIVKNRYPNLAAALDILDTTAHGTILAAAAGEFMDDVLTLPKAPPPPGSALCDFLDHGVSLSHPGLSWISTQDVWTAIRATQQTPTAPPPPANRRSFSDRLFACLSRNLPKDDPHAMILGYVKCSSWSDNWFEALYSSAEAVFLNARPITILQDDWCDAIRRVRDWLNFLEGSAAFITPFASVEIPPAGHDPAALTAALTLLDTWAPASGQPQAAPPEWTVVPNPEREILQAALISLHLEDLGRDLGDCLRGGG